MRPFQFDHAELDSQQAHSHDIDVGLGFGIIDIELDLVARAQRLDPKGSVTSWGKMLHAGAQTWIGLSPHALLTPYGELDRMCELVGPKPEGQWVDLGAGYGRLAFVLNSHSPTTHFTGIECVSERVDEGNRIFMKNGLTRARLVKQDLFQDNFQLPLADCYLIYDYGSMDHLRWTMGQLQNLATVHRFHVVARGGTIRSLISYAHPWLLERAVEERFSVYANHV